MKKTKCRENQITGALELHEASKKLIDIYCELNISKASF